MTTLKNCFLNSGIEAPSLPQEGSDAAGGGGGNFMDTILMRSPEEFCQKKVQFKSAFECAMTSSIQCFPQELNGYIAQPEMMRLFLDQLCENVTYKDGECVQSKHKGLHQCLENKKSNYLQGLLKRSKSNEKALKDITEYICKYFVFYMMCLKTEASSCGCNVTSLYQRLLGDILYPPACPRSLVTSEYSCKAVVIRWSSLGILLCFLWVTVFWM
nr:hypothetical protein BgiMline_020562 [Biomphalaria glabrata]